MDATLVKIGGSLALYPEKLKVLCSRLSMASKKHLLIIVPGGGKFADVVRELDTQFNLSPVISHRMAILGMDQYGLFLSDIMPGSRTVRSIEELEKLDFNSLPIILPSSFLLDERTLENSWDVTSDSIAVYIAAQLDVRKVVLITDVDGIYNHNPKEYSDSELIPKLSVKELLKIQERTSVDRFLPKLLVQLQTECFVVNGLYPERVEAILNGQDAVFTVISKN